MDQGDGGHHYSEVVNHIERVVSRLRSLESDGAVRLMQCFLWRYLVEGIYRRKPGFLHLYLSSLRMQLSSEAMVNT